MEDDLEALVGGESPLLATVLDQTHDCIKLLNSDGIIEYVNRQGALAMELSSPAELVGEFYLLRWPEDARPLLEAALAAARSGKLGRFQASRPKPDGSPSWWDVSISPVRAPSGEVSQFVSIARNMTSEVLERQRVEAISLEMRHRLKNAMTVAAGVVRLSARGHPEASEFASQIVSRLNQLASVETSVLDPQSEKQLAHVVHTLAEAYGEDSSITFGEMPSVKLSHNGMQALALCFGELVTNSLKYGALRKGSRVFINGFSDNGTVELSWREETDFGAMRPGGQGLSLIERLIKTAGGGFTREVGAGEMLATMTLPAH